jgi:hypothetical protein
MSVNVKHLLTTLEDSAEAEEVLPQLRDKHHIQHTVHYMSKILLPPDTCAMLLPTAGN